jgi:hypothetical protein
MKKIGMRIFLCKKSISFIPNISLYYFKGYQQMYDKYYPDEYILVFVFLNLNIELRNNKYWKGFFNYK